MYQILPALVLCLAAGLVCSPVLAGNNYKIASWNIADFHHGVGIEARENIGTRRYPADFNTLRKYANKLDADIVALQEIVTEKAARQLFPASQYWLFMSSRYHADLRSRAESDIYTAVAVRKGVGINPVRQADFAELQIEPSGGNPYERATRRGTAVLLDIGGRVFWVMSVHLKSSCPKVKKPERSRQSSCKMLWRQSVSLKRWIGSKMAEGSDFVIAGDFNRRFGRLKNNGSIWQLLAYGSPGDPTAGAVPVVARFPGTQLRRCPTRKGKGVHPIDWFVVNSRFARQFNMASYFETRWSAAEVRKHRHRLSDHCPISIEFSIADR